MRQADCRQLRAPYIPLIFREILNPKMMLDLVDFDASMPVSEIVRKNYRTADIFQAYGIEFCCAGKRPLALACQMMGIDAAEVTDRLNLLGRASYLPPTVEAQHWPIDFLTEYIVNVHHTYLKNSLSPGKEYLARFAEGHEKKYPFVRELLVTFNNLVQEMIPHLKEEEEIIFPYIRQIANAYYNRESYASLLVRTLRKPVEKMMHAEHESLGTFLHTMRRLTNHYTPPENACVNHFVTFSKLKEIDKDLQVHLYLENEILFPKAVQMEKELLEK